MERGTYNTFMGLQVLIVEDEAIVSYELQLTLEEFGHQVIGIASRGEDAIDFVKHKVPDLVLMDMRLAGERDGASTAVTLRHDLEQELPTVFVTAWPQYKVPKLTHSAILTKPFSRRELIRAIERAVDHTPQLAGAH
jgi:CheY-like chemotaxis protein